MTLDEEQEFKILKILIEQKIDSFTFQSLPQELKSIIGSGDWNIIRQMSRKGLFLDVDTFATKFEVTNAAKSKYLSFKKKKRLEFVKAIAFWLTLIGALISAGYAVATYYADGGTKYQKSTIPLTLPVKPQLDTVQKLLQPARQDTTNSKKIALHNDSLLPTQSPK